MMATVSKDEKRPLSVLFINDTARNGGPGRALYSILRFADRQMFRRTIMLPRPGVISELFQDVADEIVFEPRLVENPFEPWDRPIERADLDAPSAVKAARLVGNVVRSGQGFLKSVRFIREKKFDLIYCNGTNACFAGAPLAKLTGVPALWHVHYTSVPSVLEDFHQRLSASRGVREIVCVSNASARLFDHVAGKVTVIHNLLDVADFDRSRVTPALRAELGLGPDVVVFGSHGRVLRRKGYVEFIEAAAKMLSELGETDRKRAHFVVVGDTPQDFVPDHLQECRAVVVQRKLEENIHFIGFRPDPKPYIADFDVTVVPSVYPDPLPLSVIEGMAMETAVIAFDVGGVSEMMVPGETGALVSEGNVEGLAKEMRRYFDDRDLRVNQGRAARQRIIERYDGRKQVVAFEDVMRRAAASPR